jgi:hypothetical protein
MFQITAAGLNEIYTLCTNSFCMMNYFKKLDESSVWPIHTNIKSNMITSSADANNKFNQNLFSSFKDKTWSQELCTLYMFTYALSAKWQSYSHLLYDYSITYFRRVKNADGSTSGTSISSLFSAKPP